MSGPKEVGVVGPGTELDGFVIERIAGRGGMGVVYLARQTRPDRLVALKVIAADLAGEPGFRARFQRESSVAAQIEHPNVIPVYAVGEADGVLYIAMRYVDGTDLRTMLADEGRLEPHRAATIVDQVAQALDVAHAHGLVHRDVKPANILVSGTGGRDHVYLSDFGLSRHIEGSQGLTGTGAFLGTIDYVAPEQARGEPVDARTDVYSLGCVLFQTLTGTVPFPMDNDLAKLYAHDTKPAPSVRERAPDLPPAFEAVLQRAMAKAPNDRYLSAGDLGRAALAAASDTSLSRAERSVAVGGAAPQEATPVPARPAAAPAVPTQEATQPAAAPAVPTQEATQPAAAPAAPTQEATQPAPAPGVPPPVRRLRGQGNWGPVGRDRRMVFSGAGAVVAVGVVALVVALSSGGGKGSSVAQSASHASTSAASGPSAGPPSGVGRRAVGLVPGRSIGPVSLGEPRRLITADLVGRGWTATPGNNAQEERYTLNNQIFVVGFAGSVATYIQKYGDPSIKIGGVSINSTLRAARAALPNWHSARCPQMYTFLIGPGGHTYFEFPQGPDERNASGANGIVVSTDVVTVCG